MVYNHAQPVSRLPPYLQTTSVTSTDGAGPEQPANPLRATHSREASVTRGRTTTGPPANNGFPTPSSHRVPSAQPATADSPDNGLQRRTSNNYGHHRQTSVIHGVQHSRNTSFNSPLTSSPLSPESLHNAGLRNATGPRRPPGASIDGQPQYSPPIMNGQGHNNTPSIDSTLGNDPPSQEYPPTHSRRGPAAASRGRRGHAYGPSFGPQPELRTPGEYALHHLFHAFVIRADQKINHCIANMETLPIPVEQVCGAGADAAFDQLISALGHIARQDPKPLVDSLMFWRQAKADTASSLRKQLNSHKSQGSANTLPTTLPAALPRRHTEPLQMFNDSPQLQVFSPPSISSTEEEASEEFVLADRQATVSVYILCRVLIEIFDQSDLASIKPDLAFKLEDIVFTQLKTFEPQHITTSSLRVANWRIYGQVLGKMSRLDFVKVATRFTQQLGSWQQDIASSSGTAGARDLENRVELMLLSMQNLCITTAPASVQLTCDFLRALGLLFVDSHGPTIKQAYCLTFESFLLQIASEPDRLQNVSKFREFTDMVHPRATQMLTKLRHWSSALPLSNLLTCLSPWDVFSSQWYTTVVGLSTKLKDRSTRTPAMRAICQLAWTYLRRSPEPITAKSRKMEDVIKLILPGSKRAHISTEPSIAEALVQFARIIGLCNPDLCFRAVIFPLINFDILHNTRELRIEQLDPEKMVIGIRSFLSLMSDLEKSPAERLVFPVFSVKAPPPDLLPASPTPSRPRISPSPPIPNSKVVDLISATPVNVQALDETSKQHYLHFCEILGKITILCDHTFGSSAVFNEKFSILTPKTPLVDAFSLNKKDDGTGPDQKQSYYGLLHVAIQALPRCFSDHIPLNTLINLLCTGSAHVQPHVASSAAKSLKAIARQGHAQAVATAFPRFIFQYDSQYSTMSDEGRLGPAHIETTLALYLELLQIWTEQIKQKAQSNIAEKRERNAGNASRAMQMEMTNVIPLVDEIEGYGLFFLCSQSRRVRTFAIKVLRLVLQFDEVLGKNEQSRVIRVLESKSTEILDINTAALSVAERSRLQKDKSRSGTQNTLIEISSSEITYDATLWFKAFPNLARLVFELCPSAVALSRGVVTDRLALMQPDVERLAGGFAGVHEFRLGGRSSATPVEVFFDQWKLYLIMACVTLSSPGAQSQSQLANAAHARKASQKAGAAQDRLSSARALFSAVIPMLGAAPEPIRDAVVIALGSINRKLYRTLLESLQYAVITCNDEAKARIIPHQRTPSSPQRSLMTERMRTEVTHIYKLTASFLRNDDVLEDEWVLNNLVNYTRDLRLLLSDDDIHGDWRFAALRFHYCGLVEELYENVSRSTAPSRWMPFESRKSAFTLMEEWCGYAAEQDMTLRRDEDQRERNVKMEKEKNSLRLAALSAMAALCAGPISIITESNTVLHFNLPRMLSWIDTIFATNNDKMHVIGQRALSSLILHNPDQPHIIEHAIQRCYGIKGSRALESCFAVMIDVLIQRPDYPVDLTKIFGAVILTLGNDSRDIRMKSARLLRTLDEKQQNSSNLQEFEMSISDNTRAVYKLAQFEYSKRLAQTHPHLAFLIFSECSFQFKQVNADQQRSMVAAILPWVQTLELQVDPATGGPTILSYMLLANMLEITIRNGSILHNEVQALWQALATGPHAGNVQLILDFIISLSLERKEQNFVEYAKQIVVHLASTPAGSRVLEFFLLQLVPKNMINEKKTANRTVPDMSALPYAADLANILPTGHKQAGLSLGQLSLIFLVDLMVSPVSLKKEDAIKLVHVVFILWDHYTAIVQEQAREMLIHLIHELVSTKIDRSAFLEKRQTIEDLVEVLRKNEREVTWSYEDHTGKNDYEVSGNRVPAAMTHLSQQVVDIFGLTYDRFCEQWAKEALNWASICPVRHLACRSFQIFRCISVSIDSKILADMLARLSNTIADEHSDYQTFSLEILTTLRVIIGSLDKKSLMKYPQLFWTTCACLDTIHEREFFESLCMLEQLADVLDLTDTKVIEVLLTNKPDRWEGGFEGLQNLLYKGLKSADCLDRTLLVLHKLASIPDNDLVGRSDRLLFNVLANLPTLLHDQVAGNISSESSVRAQRLATVARNQELTNLASALDQYKTTRYEDHGKFLKDVLTALQAAFFPLVDARSLIFMMGLLTNRLDWFRAQVMEILCELIPLVDMKSAAITCHGPDLISPLLRLLQTDLCEQALTVMDHIMEVSVTPMDRHHLRMSMASGPARAIRKEYERTQSLYGIPEASGWSIPMPAVHSNSTRSNVHAVFYTCGAADGLIDLGTQTPEVEFHADEGYIDSYFPIQDQPETMRSLTTATDTNMEDIVSSLDSLDDFFDEPDSVATPTAVAHAGLPDYMTSGPQEHGTTVYDEQTAPILSRTLNRASSSLSFQNGLAESRPSISQFHRTQSSFASTAFSNQSSFSSIDEISGPGPSLSSTAKKTIQPAINTTLPVRPGLHSRSITTPAHQSPPSQPISEGFIPSLPTISTFQSTPQYSLNNDEVLSDSENSPFPTLSATSSNASMNMLVSGPGFSHGTPATSTSANEAAGGFVRRGMRRLTGGKSESAREKEKLHLRAMSGGQNQPPPPSGQSPRMPRIPLEYLNSNNLAGAMNASSPRSPGM